ncbi:hypothetical protein SNEBB_004519 [Seison nebaliae]|nr:hypothetical protein SNEBB_004519 [Seison nebaliae]
MINEKLSVPDGGWGWMIVLGCSIVQFSFMGYLKAFGIFYHHLLIQFGNKGTFISILPAANIFCFSFCGIFAAKLIDSFGYRTILFMGSILFTAGLVSCSLFITNIYMLFFSHGVMAGVGCGLLYIPSVCLVSEYFEKRKTFALSLATSSSGIGALILPIIMKSSLQFYGMAGAFLLTASTVFHSMINAAVARPMEWKIRSNTKKSKVSLIEWRLLKKYRKFLIFSLFNLFQGFGVISFSVMIPSHAIIHYSLNESHTLYFVMAYGFMDTFGRLFISLLSLHSNISKLNKTILLIVNALMMSLSTLTIALFATNPIIYGLLCGIRGFLTGEYFSLLISGIVDMVDEKEEYSPALSLQEIGKLFQSTLIFLLIDFVRKFTGEFTISLIILSVLHFIAFCILFLNIFIIINENEREELRKKSKFLLKFTPE